MNNKIRILDEDRLLVILMEAKHSIDMGYNVEYWHEIEKLAKNTQQLMHNYKEEYRFVNSIISKEEVEEYLSYSFHKKAKARIKLFAKFIERSGGKGHYQEFRKTLIGYGDFVTFHAISTMLRKNFKKLGKGYFANSPLISKEEVEEYLSYSSHEKCKARRRLFAKFIKRSGGKVYYGEFCKLIEGLGDNVSSTNFYQMAKRKFKSLGMGYFANYPIISKEEVEEYLSYSFHKKAKARIKLFAKFIERSGGKGHYQEFCKTLIEYGDFVTFNTIFAMSRNHFKKLGKGYFANSPLISKEEVEEYLSYSSHEKCKARRKLFAKFIKRSGGKVYYGEFCKLIEELGDNVSSTNFYQIAKRDFKSLGMGYFAN